MPRQRNQARRERAQRMAARGASAARIERRTGVSRQAATRFVNRAAASTGTSGGASGGTSAGTSGGRTTPQIRGVKQGLRIAGAGGISRGDLKTIMGATDKGGSNIIQKLDKLNQKLKGKDKTGISLNAGAANMLLKRASKRQTRGFGFKPVDFGQGRIGKTLQGMLGTPGSPGTMIKGQLVGAREAVEPTRLAGGMQIRPGGRERVQGFGKQYELPERFKPKEEVVDQEPIDQEPIDQEPIDLGEDIEPVIPPEEEEEDTSLSSGAGGLDLASWATGFRRARSARQRAGRGAQGTGSMKKFKFKESF